MQNRKTIFHILLYTFTLGICTVNFTQIANAQEVVYKELATTLDSIYHGDQDPLVIARELREKHGIESEEAKKHEAIFRENKDVREAKVMSILDEYGWLSAQEVGDIGNEALWIVIQHAALPIQLKYLPMMQEAAKNGKVEKSLLAFLQDRIESQTGQPQTYGNTVKFYPKTKSTNVWPIKDPANVDKRRAEVGLGPIAERLKNRFKIDWDVEEQIARTANFNEIYEDKTGLTIGNSFQFYSSILTEERQYSVMLPHSYYDDESKDKHYPILVLLDGNWHDEMANGVIKHLSGSAQKFTNVPEVIIVAIDNVDRRRDFTPDHIVTVRKNTSGGGDQFLKFVEEELLPHISNSYRTEPFEILVGHSLGGLITLHAFTKEETKFDAFISIDPSIPWETEMMDKKIKNASKNVKDRTLYIASALNKRPERNKDRHQHFVTGLQKKSAQDLGIGYHYFENEDHRSVVLVALEKGLRFVYNK